jgi:ParB family chromosome partitioning protein
MESLELALVENIHRKDLNPIEEALAYRKLMEETGATQDALAKRLGKDRSSIANLLRLLKLPVSIQKDVINGQLSMGHARVVAGLKTRQEQKALRDMILKKDLSVRQAEAIAKRRKTFRRLNTKRAELDYYMQSLSDNLKRSLGTKVDIRKRGRQGRIVIYFYSDDELDRLLELLA